MIFKLKDGRTVSIALSLSQYAIAWKMAGECGLRISVPVPTKDGATEYIDIQTFEKIRMNGPQLS